MGADKDVTFGFDKYNQALLSDRKTTIANAIINACFMVPGNLPSMPNKGVNIRQYFYKEENSISSDKIKQDLEATCGKVICGAVIKSVDFSTQKTTKNDVVFLLIILLSFSPDKEELLGITMQQKQDKYVKFNFDYIDV